MVLETIGVLSSFELQPTMFPQPGEWSGFWISARKAKFFTKGAYQDIRNRSKNRACRSCNSKDASFTQLKGGKEVEESSFRPVSTGKLNVSPHLHLRPINLVVYKGPFTYARISYLEAGFPLRCFQRLSLPNIATRRCDWRHNRYTRGSSTLVLSY